MTVAPAEGHVPGPAQAAATSPLLEVRNLHTAFPARGRCRPRRRGRELQRRRGRDAGLVGESGSGKSVTLRSLLGLVPEPGRVIDGEVPLERPRPARGCRRPSCARSAAARSR